jgi:selenocysteine lyase/cysteine desulfurase
LAFLVKVDIGQETMDARNVALEAHACTVWSRNPPLEMLGIDMGPRLPFFSFRVRYAQGGFAHHQLFTRMLCDFYGIQVRGGCVCAGPYSHRLPCVSEAESEALLSDVLAGQEIAKLGCVRRNFSVLMDDGRANRITAPVDELSRTPRSAALTCHPNPAITDFTPVEHEAP